MGTASHFNRILHRELDIYAAWLPVTNAFELGDYGVVSDGVFVKMGHICEFGIDFNRALGAPSSIDFKSEGTSLFRLVGDVQADALPDADIEAKLKIQFSHENSFLIKAALAMEQMTNMNQVARQLNQADGWRRKFRVISHIFTHVHLLAHGDVVGKGHRARFGLALHAAASGRSQVVTGEQLAAALGAESQAGPEIVTIAACDGANLSNTLVPGSSVAYALHAVGVPIVLASQLPLTFEGSLGLPTLFLAQVFCGADVRDALHDLRVHLYEHQDTCGHDWLSLVAYVRLPEQYEARLRQRGLSAMLGALDTAQVWSDHLDTHGVTDPEPFERAGRILQGRIDDLIRFLKQGGDHVIKDENLGLLGSAEKRLAALWFRRWQLTQAADGLKQSHEALQRAHTWYFASHRNNLSHHWSGVQHLALEAVLQGEIKDRRYWDAAYLAAETEAQQEREIWAFGTLAELHLLSPCVGAARNLQAAERALTNLQQRIRSFGADPFPIASTQRQLRRYVDWWRTPYGFFGGRVDLAEDAARLLRVLESG